MLSTLISSPRRDLEFRALPLGNHQRRRNKPSLPLNYACCACGEKRRAPNSLVFCERCDDAIQRWGRTWNELGMLPRCPISLREARIAAYAERVRLGLDLFEQPLSLPVRD